MEPLLEVDRPNISLSLGECTVVVVFEVDGICGGRGLVPGIKGKSVEPPLVGPTSSRPLRERDSL